MTGKKLLIAPSILSADFSRLLAEVRSVERAGADLLHIDVMDGHFVPNISIGPVVIKSLKGKTKLELDVHLMISDPVFFLDAFLAAGSDAITVHAETCTLEQIGAIAGKLKQQGKTMGISINPGTPLEKLAPALPFAERVLVMSVNPGFGGQAFMPEVLPKIAALRRSFAGDIAIDGGINQETAAQAAAAGVDILVAGSYIFQARRRAAAIRRLKTCKR